MKIAARIALGLLCTCTLNANAALIAEYTFDGNANDTSGNGNDATVNGATLTTDRFGANNSAYLFDGTDDSIFTSLQRSDYATDFSVSAWFRFDGNIGDTYTPVIGSDNQLFFVGKDLSNSNIGVQQNGYVPNAGAGTNAWDAGWHHVVASFAATAGANSPLDLSLYLDDVLVGTSTFSGAAFTAELTIGFEADPGIDYYFEGVIDDVRFYDNALSSGEVTALFNDTPAVPLTPAIALLGLGLILIGTRRAQIHRPTPADAMSA